MDSDHSAVILTLSEKITKRAAIEPPSLTEVPTGKASRLAFRTTSTGITALERLNNYKKKLEVTPVLSRQWHIITPKRLRT